MNNCFSLLFGKRSILKLNDGNVIRTIILSDFCSTVKDYRAFLNKNMGIYAWHNESDNKVYIGSAKNLWNRFRFYKNAMLNGTNLDKLNVIMANKIKKYTHKNFKFYVLQICSLSESNLRQLEESYFNEFKPFGEIGYNIANKTVNYCPQKLSDNAIEKIKEANTGENSSNAVLDNKKVFEIKIALSEGKKLKYLSKKYNVSITVISNIKRGLTWSHIKIPKKNQDEIDKVNKRHKRKNFSKELVVNIKEDLNDGIPMTVIAKKYNIGYTAVSGLKYGHYYKNVTP